MRKSSKITKTFQIKRFILASKLMLILFAIAISSQHVDLLLDE
uniref:Uncharacterized protein n=1 Tax=Arundo donax TaxID=35708 RepID=A0A0A9EE93_ARUDO